MQILTRARAVLCLVLTVILAVAFVACGEEKDPDTGKHEHVFENGICSCGKYEVDFITSLPMSQSLQAACDEAGTVVTVSYPTRAYAYEAIDDSDVEIPITKKAQIYLPYGYDENTKYDIVYLMHGAGETYEYWLTKMGTTTRNVLEKPRKPFRSFHVFVAKTSPSRQGGFRRQQILRMPTAFLLRFCQKLKKYGRGNRTRTYFVFLIRTARERQRKDPLQPHCPFSLQGL